MDGLEPAVQRRLWGLWKTQARSQLQNRLSAAETLRSDGNDKYCKGDFEGALEEYQYALELFKYEIANLLADQEDAELGDEKRGLGSEDLPRIQEVRVPCLLNSAACLFKLRRYTEVLGCCEEALRAHPPSERRAKAHYRSAQANLELGNPREAWASLQTARALHPGSKEIRELQLVASRDLKALKSAEREDRAGMMGSQMNHKQIFKQEKRSYSARIGLLRKLLPPHSPSPPGCDSILERTAHVGWANLSQREQLLLSELWSSALPRLRPEEVRDGRDAGVYPPRDEEKIFGINLPSALMGKPFPREYAWLTPEQKQLARGLALTIWKRGVEDLDDEERRYCEGINLLASASHHCRWHKHPLSKGGAQLILSQVRHGSTCVSWCRPRTLH